MTLHNKNHDSFQPKIVFHDRANGGWFCKACESYIHPDLIYSHSCIGLWPHSGLNHGSGGDRLSRSITEPQEARMAEGLMPIKSEGEKK